LTSLDIHIRLFAGISELVGETEWNAHVPENANIETIRTLLIDRWPALKGHIDVCFFAINEQYATLEKKVCSGDRVAIIPPVSGGSPLAKQEERFLITTEPLSADAVLRLVANPATGAVLTFVGTVREFTAGKRTVYLSYQAYEQMAIQLMRQIGAEIEQQWPGASVAIAHRIGELAIEELSVVIAVATPHRPAAFEAGRYAIERLKQIVPIWKKEVWEDGSEWIGGQSGPWNPTMPLSARNMNGGHTDNEGE